MTSATKMLVIRRQKALHEYGKNSKSYKLWRNKVEESRLGPLLFAVLVNSLLKYWPGRVKFVDDTTAIEVVPRCSPSLLSIVVNQISDFANERGMVLNPKKCMETIITFLKYKQSENNIFIGDDLVERVKSFKLLGVW